MTQKNGSQTSMMLFYKKTFLFFFQKRLDKLSKCVIIVLSKEKKKTSKKNKKKRLDKQGKTKYNKYNKRKRKEENKMTNLNINEVMVNYTEEERNIITNAMMVKAIIGTKCPQTKEELKEMCENILEAKANEEAKKEARAKAKAEKENAKAEAMGMNLDEYKAYKKAMANKKCHETKIKNALAEIEKLKKEIAYHERKVAEYEAEING